MSNATRSALMVLLLASCGRQGDAGTQPEAPSNPTTPAAAAQTQVPRPERRSAEEEAREQQPADSDPEETRDRMTLVVSVADDTPEPAATAKAVRGIVLLGRSAIRGCFDARLGTEPGFTGRMLVSWSIMPGGAVESSSIAETNIMNDAIEECVLAKLGHLEFKNAGAAPIAATLRLELGR